MSKPTHCIFCHLDVADDHWFWMNDPRYTAGGKWRCKVRRKNAGARARQRVNADPDRLLVRQVYHQKYHAKNPWLARYKAYKHGDKEAGRLGTLSPSDAKELMHQPCNYCGLTESGGLDRKDCTKGHALDNVLPCCEKCNNILGDLPQRAKDVLVLGLAEIRHLGLLADWVIPTKRRK